jgi:hypothetical protein
MATVKMSIHRGLAEIKLYDKKIETGLRGSFVVPNKVSNKMIGGRSLDDVRKVIKGNFDSTKALIENRKIIKQALVMSNAKTHVSVAGKDYSVAEAIERKNSIQYDVNFLNTLKNQYSNANNQVENNNTQLPSKLETYLVSVLGDKASRDPESVKAHTKVFEDSNKFELIDPAKIADFINDYETEIDEFTTQVDYVLSESNAVTFVEVDLVD